MTHRHLLLTAALFVVACGDTAKDDTGSAGDDTAGDGGGDHTGDGACVSDSYWTGGNHESPNMHPGMDCIACHTAEGEGPRYTVAGTVFTNYDEPDDCNGVQGVQVEVTDAAGNTWTETTNAAGNFSFRDSGVQFPITARVIDGDQVREMASQVETGACATCHTQDGADGAPGRVIAP